MRQTTLAGQSKLYGLKSKVGDTPAMPRSLYIQFNEFRPCSKWRFSLLRDLSAIAPMDIVITVVTGRSFVERPKTFSRRILCARFISLSLLQRLGAVEGILTRDLKSCCAGLYFRLSCSRSRLFNRIFLGHLALSYISRHKCKCAMEHRVGPEPKHE